MAPDPPEPERWDPSRYRRPEMPFERKAEPTGAGMRWAAAGIEFGVAVVGFFLVGNWLDEKLGSGPWLAMTGSLVGVAVGTYLLVRPLFRPSSRDGNDSERDGLPKG